MRETISAFCDADQVPGYVLGVYQGGTTTTLTHGVANVTTGAPMTGDTGFLFGSVTKIMTTTLVLQQVERGTLRLDEPVADHLPGLPPGILVRHLLNHTSGIDADLFFPDATGPGALAEYVRRLPRECGTLFAPGELVSYSNGGMIVAGRLLEVATGRTYPDLLADAIYRPAGMATASTSAAEAILRPTAVGHFPGEDGIPRRTGMFMLPDTWGPAGGTPIGTVADLLAFGRAHLDDGGPLLSAGSAAAMRTVSADLGTPNTSPIGLGWLLARHGDTTVLSMTGASPGGVAVLAVAPSLDLVFVAYGNAPQALALHEDLLLGLLPETDRLTVSEHPHDLTPYAGTYRSNQLRVDVRVVGGALEETVTYEPADASQERIFTGFAGGRFPFPPMRYVPVGPGLFAPEGLPLDRPLGYTRQLLVSYHGEHRNAGGRLSRRVH
ncbi:serine hydrolase domain-containing protein [Cryptosporangium japonicum]|uniref:Beta-lactamase-related domain-containing protein n=1 Tax=Cryptosporangium japonicum TaxID=80872 RepID=A0ABP3E4P7_9ACTN